jgi:CubicO group peptidase (beta-lactamase class C family)
MGNAGLHRRAVLTGVSALLLAPAAAVARSDELNVSAAARYSAERRGVSLLVMQRGAILYEDYPNGGGADRAWELASGTKSFSGILAAAAAADGLLSIDESAAKTLPEWRSDPRKSRITLRQLLTLTSGVVSERIGIPPPYADAVTAPAAYEPGTHFDYGPTPFQIFGEIMRRKLADAGRQPDGPAYLRARVLEPNGVHVTRWRNNFRDDLPLMPQGAQLTARNWARFGQYVLDGGAGLDPATFRACFEPTRANPGYGLTWWLLRPGLIPPAGVGVDGLVPGEALAREDIVMAAGLGNQRLYLLRARDLVVARQASGILRAQTMRPAWRDGEFLRALLA